MKKYQFVSLLLATSILSNSVLGVIDLDQVCDLSGPFMKRGAQNLNPIAGVDSSLIKGLRFHGHYGSRNAGFPAVVHNQLKPDDLPQEEVAAFLQRLFPSPVHDVLAANNLQHDDVRKWLTPQAIARLMVVVRDQGAFLSKSVQDQMLGLYKALTPVNYSQRLGAIKKNKSIKRDEELPEALLPLFYERFQKDRKVYAFVELMHKAFASAVSKEHPNHQFYGPDIVRRALFNYMCLQIPGKKGLKPYYDTLAELGVIDATDAPDYQSRMSQEAYESLKRDVMEGRIPFDEFLSSPEMVLQLRYGYDLFEDTLPPSADYLTVTYVDPEGERRKFSNCGEATLLTFLAALMFNPNLHAFDTERVAALSVKGCSLKPEYVDFLEQILTSPAAVNSTVTQNKFVQIISNLNTPETVDEIRYRKLAGKVVKKRNGIYEINAGLDNFLRVIGALIGDPNWSLIQGKDEEISEAVTDNLTRLCGLFSSEGFSLDWKVKNTGEKNIQDVKAVGLTFSYNGTQWFHLSFGPSHFEFKRASEEGGEDKKQLAQRILETEKPWQPYFAQLIPSLKFILEHTFKSSEAFESYIKGYLFSSDLGSLKGRTKALSAILKYREMTGSSIFDFLYERWIKPGSEFFDKWNDVYTNYKVLNILATYLSIEEIRALGIHQFTEYLMPGNWAATFARACANGRKHIGKLILDQEGAMEALSGQQIDVYWTTSEEESETDAEESDGEVWDDDEGSGSENADNHSSGERQPDESISLMHSLAILDLPEYMERALAFGGDLESLDSSERAPIQLAVECDSTASLIKLIEMGSDTGVTFSDGSSLLDMALNHPYVGSLKVLLQRGFSPTKPCTHFSNPPKDGAKIIRLLQEHNTPFPLFGGLLTHSSVSLDVFMELAQKHVDVYRKVFEGMIASLSSSGQVHKLKVLKDAGVSATGLGFHTAFQELTSTQRKEICLMLIDMQATIECMVHLCETLEIDDFREVVSKAPQKKKHLFKLQLNIKSKEDLEKANELKRQGIQFSRLSFNPSIRMEVAQRIELVEGMATFGCELDHTHLLQLSDEKFEEFMEHCSPKALKGVEKIIALLANVGKVEKLNTLKQKGFKPTENWHASPICPKRQWEKVCLALFEMGGDSGLLNAWLGFLDMKALSRVLKGVSAEKRAELRPVINIYSPTDLAKFREVKRLGCDPTNIHTHLSGSKNGLTIADWKELLQGGVVLKDVHVGFMSVEDFREVVFEYPSERKQELAQLIIQLVSNGELAKLRILKEAGVKPDTATMFNSPSDRVSMETRVQLCLVLLEMSENLIYFSILLNSLDADGYSRVISAVRKERMSEFSQNNITIQTLDDLEMIRAHRKVGIEVSSICFSPNYGLSGEQMARLLLELNELGVLIWMHNLDSFSIEAFGDFVKSYPAERKQELAVFIPQISTHGALAHLRVLKEANVVPAECHSFTHNVEVASMETQAQVCIELLEMGGDLSCFSHLLNGLDGPQYGRVLALVTPDKIEESTRYQLTIREQRDFGKVRARRQAGLEVDYVSFCPIETSGAQLACLLQESHELKLKAHFVSLNLVSDEAFDDFVQQCSSDQKHLLAQIFPSLVQTGSHDRLRKLRDAGVTFPKDTRCYRNQISVNAFEVVCELMCMGATISQLIDVLIDFEATEILRLLASFAEQSERELDIFNVLFPSDIEKLGVIVREGNVKLGHLFINCCSLMSTEEKKSVMLGAIELGKTLSDLWDTLKTNLDVHALRELLQEYPKQRVDEIKKGEISVFETEALEKVIPLVEAGMPLKQIYISDSIEVDKNELEKMCLELLKLGVDINDLNQKLLVRLNVKSVYKILSQASPDQSSEFNKALFSIRYNKVALKENAAVLIAVGADPDYTEEDKYSFRRSVSSEAMSLIEAQAKLLKLNLSAAE